MGCWRGWLLLLVFMCCCATISSHGDHHHCGHEHHHEHQHEHHHDAGEQQSPAQHGAHHAHQHSAEQFRRLPEELAEEEELAGHGFLSGEAGQPQAQEPQAAAVWLTALGCALLVSTASLICLLLLPFILKDGKPSAGVVDALAGFGAGAMLGDALLHQLPHAFSSSGHSHDHGHDHDHDHHGHGGHGHSIQDLSIGLSVLAGILVFFIVEKLVRYVEEASAQAGISSSHSHHHHRHGSSAGDGKADADGSDAQQVKKGKKVQTQGKAESKDAPGWVLAYLNLFSDGVHNFTDGMALGSAFLLHGGVGGWSRTLFLLAHELPQEVGDFGILVRSGLSVSKALALNFLSALAAVAGTALALVLGGNPGHSSFVEAFTAGGFIYISLAGVIPGMHDQGSSPKTSLRQLASLSLGVGVAIAISLAE